jgi:hypothetical protein
MDVVKDIQTRVSGGGGVIVGVKTQTILNWKSQITVHTHMAKCLANQISEQPTSLCPSLFT